MNRKLFLTLFLGVLMAALDIAVLGPALPAIRLEFATDTSSASWLVTLYVLANLLGTPLLGGLSDRWGRGRTYRLAVGLFALGSLAILLAPNLATLLVARALQGFGAGGIFPVASAAIGDLVAPEKRGRYLGLIGATFGMAFLVGPPLGSLVLHFADWRWIFGINLPLSALVLWWSWWNLPDTQARQPKPMDVAGILLLGTVLVSLALAASLWGAGASSASLLACLGIAVAALAILPVVERHAAAPFLSPRLLGNRAILIPLLLGMGAGLGEVGVMFLPDYAVEVLGATPARAGFLLVSLVVGLTIGSPLAGRLTDRFGARPVLVAGSLFQVAGLAVFALDASPTATTWYIGGPLLGLGLAALLGGPLRYALIQAAPEDSRTSAQAMLSLSHSVGQIGTSTLLGTLAGLALAGIPGSGLRRAMAIAAVAGLVLVPLSWMLPEGIRKPGAGR
jgi:EmrB/QacA subfamily drug resistance transporter